MAPTQDRPPQSAPKAADADTTAGMSSGQWGRMLIELGPLIVFFGMNSVAPRLLDLPQQQVIFWATGAFMVATIISLTTAYLTTRSIPMMPLISGIFVIVFGGLTLYLQDENFIKIKPTITNVLFSSALLGGLFVFKKPVMKYLFAGVFHLTEQGWRVLTLRWGLFFLFLAVLNEVIWRNFSTDFWVAFKVFGNLPITFIFGMAQIPVLTKYAPPEKDGDAAKAESAPAE